MKKQMSMVALALAISAQVTMAQPENAPAPALAPASQVLPAQLRPTAGEGQAAVWASRILSRYHYKAMPLDDAMSAKIFDNYFKLLDGEKLSFTQADIDGFAYARNRLDDAINNEDLTLPFQIYALYQQRFNDRLAYARELVAKGKFDFTTDETLQLDREKAPWPKSEDEVHDLWRRRVKNDWLRLKLAGNEDKQIRETLDKRYEGYQNRLKKQNHEDVFQVFMNAYATAIDPHTNYMSPRSAENFDIAMRLSLDGIGAVLQARDEYTVVREIVPAGPADKSGKLKVGDRIVGVAQGDAPFTDVTGWRLDDVVDLVRGPRNSTVRLDVLPADAGPDGKHTTITLVRQKINMEEQSARKQVLEFKEGGVKRRIGVIKLPGFYQDFDARARGDKDYKSATRDVARILGEFKKEKVDNVLIDLRNNGGGSLVEAVELTGLFIDKGPVVQQRDADGHVAVENDTDPGLAWDGPMGVLINRASASASEIFAAAIQDYGRGIVIGEPSFGKGTVQNLVKLDRFMPGDKVKHGEIKMTIAQFFRINGGTTQLRGVVPDIRLPPTIDPDTFGESSYDNALPWTQIKPATYMPSGDVKELLAPLQKRHDVRIAKDKDFQDIEQDIAEAMKLRKDNVISLNEAVRRKEREEQEAKSKAREARLAASQGIGDDAAPALGGKEPPRSKVPTPTKPNKSTKTVVGLKGAITADDGLQGDERSLTAELAAEKAAKSAKDVYLQESAHILADEAVLLKSDTRMASRTMPYLSMLKQK